MANFDLSNVSDNSPLVKQFMQRLTKATGQMVTAFIAQKMKKIAGESTKDLDFNLENGQTVTLVVRNDGDVVRVKLNGKDTPLKNDLFHFSADSFQAIGQAGNKYSLSANAADRNSPAAVFAKAVEEIAAKVRQNQASFDKRRAQEKVVIPSRSSGGGSSSGSVTSRTKEIKTNLDDLDAQILQKTALRDELKQKLEARKAQIEQTQKEVE